MMSATLRSRGKRNTDGRDGGLVIGGSHARQDLCLDKADELNSFTDGLSNQRAGQIKQAGIDDTAKFASPATILEIFSIASAPRRMMNTVQ